MDRTPARRTARVAAVTAALLPLAGAAGADLLHCQDAEGRWIYTDDKSQCPDAKPFEPKGQIQSTSGSSAPSAAVDEGRTAERLKRARARQLADEAAEAEAQRWRDKKAKLQQAVDEIVDRREYLEEFLTQCNRGGLVYARDKAGIKRHVSCTRIETEYATLADDLKAAQRDLERLPDDCRQAGCLPGWIR